MKAEIVGDPQVAITMSMADARLLYEFLGHMSSGDHEKICEDHSTDADAATMLTDALYAALETVV